MIKTKIDFSEYLGIEQTNFFASVLKSEKEIQLFMVLESLYMHPLNTEYKKEDSLKMQYYNSIIRNLYFSIISVLRCHIYEAFSITRQAIDATLTVYRFIIEKGSEEICLLEDDKSFHYVKSYIQKKKDLYPLAEVLLRHHEFCSAHSHSDIESLLLKTVEDPQQEKILIGLQLIDTAFGNVSYRGSFLCLLKIYANLLEIFKSFFEEKNAIDMKWKNTLETLMKEIQDQYVQQEKEAINVQTV